MDNQQQLAELRARLAKLEHDQQHLDNARLSIAAEIAGLEAPTPEDAVLARKEVKEVPPRIRRFVEALGIKDNLEETFGYGTTIFDLSTCVHHLDTCGCKREFMWSRKAMEASGGADVRELPVSTPVVCEHHAHLDSDLANLHSVLVEESRHRQVVLKEVLKAVPLHMKHKRTLESGEEVEEFKVPPRLEYDKDRELVCEFEHMPNEVGIHAAVNTHLMRAFPSRRVKVPRAVKPKG